jgi:hypothetical protein
VPARYRTIIGCLGVLTIIVAVIAPFVTGVLYAYARTRAIDYYVELDSRNVIDYDKLKTCPSFHWKGDNWVVPARLIRDFAVLKTFLNVLAVVLGINGAVLLVCWGKCRAGQSTTDETRIPDGRPPDAT